jgi:glycosyltransferase involved in cell wall biosynthesis
VVGVVSPGYIDHLAAKGVPRHKMKVLTDWVDESVYRPVPYDRDLAKRLDMDGKFNVVFGGQFGVAQHLDTLLEAAALLSPRPEIQLVLVGDGVEFDRIERKVASMALTNVKLTGRYLSNEMPAIYALADVLLIHLKADPSFRLSIPGKTYAYMACGKPILAAVGGVTADIVAENSSGLTCPPEDPHAMAEAIVTLFEMSTQERERIGNAARDAAVAKFSRDLVINLHERVLTALVSARG